MSFDLIKKQKANIQKERKKITKSGLFNHPLAYQPLPKGREGATREETMRDKTKSSLDSFCAKSKNSNKPVCLSKDGKKEKFDIRPDKDAVNLFFSNLKPSTSGKRSGNISDVFTPTATGFQRRNSKNNQHNRSSFTSDVSYPGYNGKTNLMVRVNNNPEDYFVNEKSELKDRLGDMELDLPRYEEKDIYDFNQMSEVAPKKTYAQVFETEESNKKIPVSEKSQHSSFKPSNKNLEIKAKPGTTVKLSFVKPEININLDIFSKPALETVAVEEEEEESGKESTPFIKETRINSRKIEDATFSTSFSNNYPNPAEKKPTNISFTRRLETDVIHRAPLDNSNQLKDKLTVQEPKSSISRINSERIVSTKPNVPQYAPAKPFWEEEEEEEKIHITKDYQPLEGYTVSAGPKTTLRAPKKGSKLKRVFTDLKNRIVSLKDPVKNLDFQYHSGQPVIQTLAKDYEPPKSSFKPVKAPHEDSIFRSRWPKKIITKKEEKIIGQSLQYSRKFKRRFFTLKSEGAKRSAAILAVGIAVALTIPAGAYVQKIIEAKNKIEDKSNLALGQVESAKSAMLSAKPEEARKNFETAYQDFLSASDTLDEVGGGMLSIIKVLPGGSKVAGGQNILEAGKHLTSAGQIVSEAFTLFLGNQSALKKKFISTDNLSTLKDITSFTPPEHQDSPQNLTGAIVLFQDKLMKAKEELTAANELLGKVDLDDVPESKKDSFIKLKSQLPEAINGIDAFSQYSNIILSVLGHNQAKQYLFLFQNNDEIRATGGFIGTYGIMKISEGNISQLMIDGIYNPDGQLKERVIPPKPIQKMSATWSMHDANWWPDFPKSAEKIAWFYEKTGGPTVDGVISFTPKIMEDLLRITGPINHEKYGVTVTADNFVELTQYKVEKDYDKELNRPKQILSDLAPLVLEKIFNAPPEKWVEVMDVFSQDLQDRAIQMYFFDNNVQKIIADLGWSGEILSTPKDYLAVINTNISGLKTDKVIEQKINHQAEVKPDGSIVDTVTITRTHKGGNEKYDWYNAVNSDWMRVYVPKGSELLHAEGYTREVNSPPVDYEKLGFIQDEMVAEEENNTNTDPYTGTRVYEDSDKTVFANWTYVSPGETLTVKYSYLLPFKLRFDDLKKPADTYSLLVQKQSGDENSTLKSEVKGLDAFDSIYQYPDNLSLPDWSFDEKFLKDFFAGAVLVPKGTKVE